MPPLATVPEPPPIDVTPLASPAHRLLLAVTCILLSALGMTAIAIQQPWIGTTQPVRAISAGSTTLRITTTDLLEEPDVLDAWAAMDGFFARQDTLARLLRAPDARVTTAPASAAATDATAEQVQPIADATRPVRTLPVVFWFQLVVGIIAALVGAWVWALKPQDGAARAFAITGIGVLLSAHAAAVYSTRDLALPFATFRALSAANHLGATLFGTALCTMFLVHPRRVASRGLIVGLFVACVAGWLADITRIAPDPNWGTRIPLMLELVAALALAAWQWRCARGRPQDRAVLRWFAASLLIGPGLFIATQVVTAAVSDVPMPQAYAMGFFIPTYIGMALGLRRVRLFDLDAWALRMLFWAVAAGAFIGLDLAVLRLAGTASARALAVVLLLGLATMPIRQWIWTYILRRPTLDPEALVAESLAVAYAASDADRAARWQAQVQRMFDPLACEPDEAASAAGQARLRDDGAVLEVPAVSGAGILRLRHAGGGRRLFSPADVRLVDRLLALLRQAEDSRHAYEQGVRGERERIARDLHDSVSSPLLAGLARTRQAIDAGTPSEVSDHAVQDEIQRALGAMRAVVRGGGDASPLSHVLADIRFEGVERLSRAGLTVTWPLVDEVAGMLTGAQHDALVAFVREAISNILRHAAATAVSVDVTWTADADDAPRGLQIAISDNGRGLASDAVARGHGLSNLQARAAVLGGHCSITSGTDGRGTIVCLDATLAVPISTP